MNIPPFRNLMIGALILASGTCPAATITIALSGDAAPDGNGSFSGVDYPVLNDAGTVAFRAYLSGTSGGNADNRGIYRGSGGALTRIARRGQAAPDGNGSFSGLGAPALNAAGAVAFYANLTGTSGGSTDNQGIYRGSGGALTRIVRKGQAVPDGNGSFSSFLWPALNDAGAVAFRAYLTGTSGGSTDNQGIYRGSGGALTRIARRGQAAPDGNGSFSGLGAPALNDAGAVAFYANLTGTSGGSTDNQGIYRGSGGALTRIVRKGQAVPDGNGSFSSFLWPALNDAGAVAFHAYLTGTSGGNADNEGIYRGSGGALTRIVRRGQAVPDGNGSFLAFGAPALNDAGAVAFRVYLSGTSGGNADNRGIYRGSGGALTRIARSGQAAPDGSGSFSSFYDPALNDAGAVAFYANLTGTSGGSMDNQGIYLGDGQELVRVAREGQSLAGSVVTSLRFSGGSQNGYAGLNGHGQVAYTAFLADGRVGVFLFTPELHWRGDYPGSWDSAPFDNPGARRNWSLSLVPAAVHDVFIDPAVSLQVTGPAAPTTVKSLTIGGGLGLATLWLDGGNLSALHGVTVTPGGVLSGDGLITGTVTNRGEVRAWNVTIAGGNLVNHGQIRGVASGLNRINATVLNQTDGEIRVNNGESLRLTQGGHLNGGRISLVGGELEVDGNLVNNAAGRIQGRNATYRFSGGLTNSGQVQLTFGTSDIFGAIVNNATGSVINSGGGNVTFYDAIRNNGEVRTSAGSQSVFFGNYTGTGVLTGSGANYFEGGFSPGASPFLVTASTDVSFGFTNITRIELGGTLRASGTDSEYDGLDVTGGKTLTLGGTLEVVLISPDGSASVFVPSAGDDFLIFTAAKILGDFHTINLPGLSPGLDWLVSNDGHRFSLSVAAVPLPPALWLLLSGLLGLMAAGRRDTGGSENPRRKPFLAT